MDSKVSIIVPIYKVPEYMLRKCIESCINQTLKEIEIILIDDESPDNCGKICDEYAKKDSRIKVIHQKNKGLSGARNSGVKSSNGKWIMFLDGDDYIDSKTCELVLQSKNFNSLDIICFSYIREGNKNSVKCDLKGIEEKLYKEEECLLLQEKVLEFEAHFSTAYCKIIKRSFLIENNIFHNEELRQGAEGIEFNIRLFEKAKSVLVIKEYLYHYIYNENSISQKHNEKNHYYVLKCFENIKMEILKSNNKNKLMELFYVRLDYVIITTAISGYFSPSNVESFYLKKEKYLEYLNNPLIIEALDNLNLKKLDFRRRIIMILIKYKLFIIIYLLGKIRKLK